MEVFELLRSTDLAARCEGLRQAVAVTDADLDSLCAAVDAVPAPSDEGEALLWWSASSHLVRRRLLRSTTDAERHVETMSDDQALALTTLCLALADGGKREAEFLDALLPRALPLLGFEALSRPLPVSVRARVFAHLVELEVCAGAFDGEAKRALDDEPPEVLHLAELVLRGRAHA